MSGEIRDEEMDTAGRILLEGGLVAFPTETVYGLGANALDEAAAARIYEAKGRPSDNPLIVHIADLEALDKIAAAGEDGPWRKLADAFWPGPLTMIFRRTGNRCGAHAGASGGIGTDTPGRGIYCGTKCQYFRQTKSHKGGACTGGYERQDRCDH